MAFCLALTSCDDTDVRLEAKIFSQSSVKLVNYIGNSQNIHPKVLYFSEGLHGHKFWMAYTPYPDGKIECENPCIAVSDDGYHWSTPAGMTNPLATPPRGGYNSDTHLVHNPADNSLECWWREYNIKGKCDRLLRRISTDGTVWRPAEVILDYGKSGQGRLSPATVIRDGHYEMIYSDGASMWIMKSSAAAPDICWEQPRIYVLPVEDLFVWHQDFIIPEAGDGHHAMAVACCYDRAGSNNSADLYRIDIDLDNVTADTPSLLLGRDPDPASITSRSIYRSSVVEVEGQLFLYYSSIDLDWHRHLGLKVL